MDAVLTNPSADHNYPVTGKCLLVLRGLPVYLSRHDAAGAAEYEGFTEVPLVEHEGAVDRWNAALVSAVLHALAHPFEYSSRMKEP